MTKWKNETLQPKAETTQAERGEIIESARPAAIYAESPRDFNFITLQNNLQNCLSIVDNEVMKNYVPTLQNCSVVPIDDATISALEQIQFFRISELVYQEDEFSVHKLATIFNALSNKPCTLVLMIQSDGQTNDFYLGVRSRDSRFSDGTMRKLLEQSLLGLFPGSKTDDYFNEDMRADLDKMQIKAISSVTCIADYKQDKDSFENKNFIQGLEKFIYSMQGKAFTAICIANNLEHHDLVNTRKEYERIYTLMSPFANMQYNYALNKGSSISDSDTQGETSTDSTGITTGTSTNLSESDAKTHGTNSAHTTTDTEGNSTSVGVGKSHTTGTTEGTSDSETTTKTVGTYAGAGVAAGPVNANAGVTSSVSRGKTHGTSHTDSISDSISQNLTYGINSSKSIGDTIGETESSTKTQSIGSGTQYSENEGHSISTNYAHTKALTDTFGNSQAVTLNVQNKSLINTLERLEKQLERLDECESIGMWDFAAYFLGEGAAETKTAASMYRSLISGNQSGLESAAVNTWTDTKQVEGISKYIVNFLHPVFLYEFADSAVKRQAFVDATVLTSTNELAIQLGLPRKSVKGLPVIEHALFAQEVLSDNHTDNHVEDEKKTIELGVVSHFGKDTKTKVELDVESLSMHTFITGSTGAGKSTVIYSLLDKLMNTPVKNNEQEKIKFMVIEPAKGEYKDRFGYYDNVEVYGTNYKKTPLLKINPFSFPEDVHVLEHIDRLIEIFNVCWPMYAAMPAVLKDSIERAYIVSGWKLDISECKYHDLNDNPLYPNFTDVLNQINVVMNESQYSSDSKGDYKGALSTRLKSLTNGLYGQIFTSDEIPEKDLFDKNVIIDLSRTGSSETKSLIMGLLIMKLQEYHMSTAGAGNQPLKHITVLEEAHNILKRTSTEQSTDSSNVLGKSVEMLANSIAEMRTYGEGFVIADQAPGLLDMSVIRNTNTKIILRLPDMSDRELVGRSAGLNDDQIAELSRLKTFVAAVYQNNWLEPVLCNIEHNFKESRKYVVADKKIKAVADKNALVKFMISSPEKKNQLDRKHITSLVDTCFKLNIPTEAKVAFMKYIQATDKIEIQRLRGLIVYSIFNAETAFDMAKIHESDIGSWYVKMCEALDPDMELFGEVDCQKIISVLTREKAERDETWESNNLFERLMCFL